MLASSAENECVFSVIKNTKDDRRTRLKTINLSNCMTITMLTPSVKEYDPDASIHHWLKAAKRKRRINWMDEDSGPAYKKICVNEDEGEKPVVAAEMTDSGGGGNLLMTARIWSQLKLKWKVCPHRVPPTGVSA